MATKFQPEQQLAFGGIVTRGNPIMRPRGSAEDVLDFRVMPGNWLRRFSGRQMRINSGTATSQYRQFHPMRSVIAPGQANHLVQYYNSVGPAAEWRFIDINTWVLSANIQSISGAYDTNFALSNVAAVCTVREKAFFYNGL